MKMTIPFAYHQPAFWMIFLPIIIIIYQFTPSRFRWYILLAASYFFFASWSKFLVLYNIVTVLLTFVFGKALSKMTKAPKGEERKQFLKKRKFILTVGILSVLSLLIILKYKNMIFRIVAIITGTPFEQTSLIVPLGISYYTLQSISYLCDVKNGKIKAVDSILKLALYLSFFLTVMEGPIARFSDIGEDLFAGHEITLENLSLGFQKILLGLFKKIVIADHLAPGVTMIFKNYTDNGLMCLLGAVLCTFQLYMDFAGTIDIAIGAAKVFGIILPENFRQPFFAKNASEFWRRWHITLGAFLRDYVFYPVSLSKPIQKITKWTKNHLGKQAARFIGPMIALFCVWICNGLWHGPRGTYIVYGMYYFFFIFIELLLENPVKKFNEKYNLDENGWGWKAFRFIKLFIIVIIGEMLFTADQLSTGLHMLSSIFTRIMPVTVTDLTYNIGMKPHDYIIAGVGLLFIFFLDVLNEKDISVHTELMNMKTWQRWGILYMIMFSIIIFGAYGTGYDAIAMMYAGF